MIRALEIEAPVLARDREGSRQPYEAGHELAWDLPLLVECGPVRDRAGAIVAPIAMRQVGFAVIQKRAGAGEELWSTESASWVSFDERHPPPPGVELEALALADEQRADSGWEGLTILAAPRYDRSGGIYLRYGVRCFFHARVEGAELFGWSAPSLALPMARVSSQPVGVELDEGNDWVKVFSERAEVRVYRSGRVEIDSHPTDTSQHARIVMPGNGSIQVLVAPGRRFEIHGDAHVDGQISARSTDFGT